MSHLHESPQGVVRSSRARGVVAFLAAALLAGASLPTQATLLHGGVQVSGVGDSPTLGASNLSRTVAGAPDGTVYVTYINNAGGEIRVARTTNRGASFLPSVQAYLPTGATMLGSEIAVSSLGIVYVASIESTGNLVLSRSIDGGQSFSSASLGTVDNGSAGIHVGTDGHRVYVAGGISGGVGVWASDDDGGTFTSTSVAMSIAFFSLVVDPSTGTVAVAADTPEFHVRVSTDHAATFAAEQNPPGTDYYSAWTISSGPAGSYLLVAGSNLGSLASTAARIDLSTFTSQDLPNFGTTTAAQSRSIFADSCGNVVDSYNDDGLGGRAVHVSNDLGSTFGAASTVVGASSQSVLIGPQQGDVLFAYLLSGAVYLDTYANEVPVACYQPAFNPGSLDFGQVTIGNTSAPQNVTITNTAASAAQIVAISLTGDFSQTSTCLGALPAGQSCVIPVTFSPTGTGPRPGQLQVQTSTAVRTMPLTGQGHSAQAQLLLSINDSSAYARYGQAVKYIVTLSNSGDAPALGVSVGSVYSPAYDVPNTSWTCIPGSGGATCAPNGAGAFADTVNVPPNQTIIWLLTTPILNNSLEDTADLQITATGANSVDDLDTLVIFRDGFDVPYAGRVPAE